MRKLILASLTISSSLGPASPPPAAAQTSAATSRAAPLRGSLEQRLSALLDEPPFNRASWGVYVMDDRGRDRKSTRLNSSHSQISYAVFCLKKKRKQNKKRT